MSNDYISRSVAVALAMEYCPDDDGVCSKSGHDLRELLDDLENAEPADVRPVVLCRDCKNWETDWMPNHAKNYEHFCPMVGLVTSPNWFCAYGERRGANIRPEPPKETPAPICQSCGNFETCPWKNDPNIAEYRQITEGRVVGCSEYKDTT